MAASSPRLHGEACRFCDFYAIFSPSGEVLSPFLRGNFYPSRIVLSFNSTLESMMSILSVLAFPAVRSACLGQALSFVDPQPASLARATKRFELIKVTVGSRDAWQARQALLACADTAIVRCLPRHKDDKVELEIRFPAGQCDSVIDRILACLPQGEIGAITACASTRPRGHVASATHAHGF